MKGIYFADRSSRIKPVYKFLVMAIAVFLVVCFLLLGFQVREVRCEGSYLYTEEQVIAASEIDIGDSMISLHKAKTAGMILSSLPFIESVHIERNLPGTVVIYVTESDASFIVDDVDGNSWLIDGKGNVSSQITGSQLADYPTVEGITLTNPSAGAPITDCTDAADKTEALLQMISCFDLYGVTGGITTISVDALNDISFNYDSRYDVYFGSLDDLEYKVSYFASLLSNWDNGKTGVIDLTFDVDDTARFQPYSY